MSRPNSSQIVESFFSHVWQAKDPEAADEFVVEDFVIDNAGHEIHGRERFKDWIRTFLGQIEDFEFRTVETFENHDGSRVCAMWEFKGRNNGALGTQPDGQPIHMHGTAVLDVREDGKLLRNRVHRNAHEVFRHLTGTAADDGRHRGTDIVVNEEQQENTNGASVAVVGTTVQVGT
ncbi:ester cyclase [Arthrobacter sp. Y81]|uniref:ester cyclase n=1 Tax=Arthrobacter sp. Y81 TaxID=2058897 RepID=UPI000CE37F44|nr:nuclear transport factor 2 family protein [Arthrobacter sp. Y81]